MKNLVKRTVKKLLTVLTIPALILTIVLVPSSAGAYGPSVMYTPPAGAPAPGALYARAMQASNGKMYATFEQYTTGVSVFPIYESTNNGQDWTKVGEVADTHKGVGMRWEPQLYELPQAIGDMAAGTLLCAGLVLPYDRSFCEIDLYMSTDSGRNWTYVSTIAEGKVATPGDDPVWEPFLLVANDKLICYYSDERDSAYSQKLVHQTSTDGVNWSSVVDDVAIGGGQRPGMAVVAQMSNGSYIMTYEIIGNPSGAYYKISSNPESWDAANAGTVFDANGSGPYCINMNGTLILSSGGNNNLYTNTNNGEGAWSQINSVIGACYSRAIVPLSNGRLFVIGAGWNGSSLNNVTYGDMDGFGSSAGGTQGSGGAETTGGASATGGTGGAAGRGGSVSTGGVTATGGAGAVLTGGTAPMGGVGPTGGRESQGGASSGGALPATGGASMGGTTVATGGVAPANGGSIAAPTGGASTAQTGGATTSGGAAAQSAGGASVVAEGGTLATQGGGAADSAVSPAESGCSCRLVRSTRNSGAWLALLGLVGLGLRRRRRNPS